MYASVGVYIYIKYYMYDRNEQINKSEVNTLKVLSQVKEYWKQDLKFQK